MDHGANAPSKEIEEIWGPRNAQRAQNDKSDSFGDELFAGSVELGVPLLRALFPRAYVDPNREPYELDPAMFEDSLPDYVNARSPRVSAGLGTVARVVAQLEREAEQRRPDLAALAAVLEFGVEPARHVALAVHDRTAVERKALGIALLRDEQRLVVHSVTLTTEGG